jgi:hypothetical protein
MHATVELVPVAYDNSFEPLVFFDGNGNRHLSFPLAGETDYFGTIDNIMNASLKTKASRTPATATTTACCSQS